MKDAASSIPPSSGDTGVEPGDGPVPPTSSEAPAESSSSTKPRRSSGRPRGPGSGPDPTTGVSAQAQRLALAVLEVLGGLQKPSDVAKSLGLSLNRYYQVEIRAVRGLLRACEPAAASGGRPPTALLAQAEKQAARLAAENRDLKQEVSRAMALVRAARRTIGLVVPAATVPTTVNGKGGKNRKATTNGTTTKDGEPSPVQRRRSKPRVRALHTVVRLRANAAAVDAPISTSAPLPVIAAPDRPGG